MVLSDSMQSVHFKRGQVGDDGTAHVMKEITVML